MQMKGEIGIIGNYEYKEEIIEVMLQLFQQ
jgi:hypothetical protein